MFDPIMALASDLDSRLAQIANPYNVLSSIVFGDVNGELINLDGYSLFLANLQGRLTNGLLALIVLFADDNSAAVFGLTHDEKVTLTAMVRTSLAANHIP